MTAPPDIATRLRAANPLPSHPPPSPRPTRSSGSRACRGTPASRRTRRSVRRPLLAGRASRCCSPEASPSRPRISVRYFDESGSKRLPTRVSKALVLGRGALRARRQAGARPDDHGLRLLVELGERPRVHDALRGPIGLLRRARGRREAGVGHLHPSFPSKPATLGGEQPWSLTLTPDMHAMLGRLSEAAVGETVRLVFEDGTSAALPMHGRWFAYAVAGTHTQPGHRPTELRFLRDGKLVRRSTLSPMSFNTLAEARALVPRATARWRRTPSGGSCSTRSRRRSAMAGFSHRTRALRDAASSLRSASGGPEGVGVRGTGHAVSRRPGGCRHGAPRSLAVAGALRRRYSWRRASAGSRAP